jgi:hypothetical protein
MAFVVQSLSCRGCFSVFVVLHVGNLIASHMPTRSGDLHSMCIFSSFYAQVWLLHNCVLLIHVMASLWFEIGYIVDMTVSEMQLYTGLF